MSNSRTAHGLRDAISRVTISLVTLATLLADIRPSVAEDVTSNTLSEADLNRIDTYIETQLKEANIPGAAFVIVERDQITHLRGFGIAGPEGQPVTAETAFFLGSISKSFTALAIMQLVEAGKIELDAPIQEYLPWFRVADAEASSQTKVRHLLNHTSGLSTYSGRTHYSDSDMSDEAIERRVRALRKVQLTAPVGTRYQYCNANYSTLGAIIESLSGRSYEDYIQERIFDPLNMTKSYTSVEVAKQHGLATGYRYWFGKPLAATDIPYPRGDIAGAYLISCAKDMGNYLLAHMNGGRLGDTRILSASGVSRLHTPEKHLNYAMGWTIQTVYDTRMISHTGTTPSSFAQMAIFPEHQRAHALLVNAGNQLSGPNIRSLGWLTSVQLLNQFTLTVTKAPKVHTQLALLCVLLLGQVVAFAVDIRRIFRWRKHPDTRPKKKRRTLLMQGGSSITINIGIAVGLLWYVPQFYEITLSGLMLYAPDAGWLLVINAAIALLSCMVTMGMTVFLIQQSGHIQTGTAEPVNPADS